EEDSGAVFDYRIERSPSAKRNNRSPEGHGFNGGDAEVLHAGQDEHTRTRQMIEDHLSRYGARERNVGPGTRLQTPAHRAISDHDSFPPRRQRQVEPLVWHEGGDDQIEVFPIVTQRRPEEHLIDERMDDVGFAAVVLLDAVADEVRVRNEARDVLRRGDIP